MAEEIRITDLAAPELNDVQRMGLKYGESVHTELTVDAVCAVAVKACSLTSPISKLLHGVTAISAGKLHPFKCPVLGQDGKPVECKGGANLDDGQILGMDFYIKGIDDKLPGT